MATSRRGDIFENLKSSLDGMSAATGYATDWKIGYPALPDAPPQIFPCWVIEEADETADMRLYPVIDWTSRVTVWGLAIASRVAGYDPRAVADGMRDDIVRALMADPTRGGHAIDTMIRSCRRESAVDPHVVVSVDVEILYRVRTQEPERGL